MADRRIKCCICSKVFTTMSTHMHEVQTCSEACRLERRRQRDETRKERAGFTLRCQMCHKEFRSLNSKAMYCCKRCVGLAAREAKSELDPDENEILRRAAIIRSIEKRPIDVRQLDWYKDSVKR